MTTPTSGAAGEISSTGLAANVAGALAYVLGPVTGLIFLLVEKDSRFVRFHAAQSVIVFVSLFVISMLLGILSAILAFIPLLGPLVAGLLGFAVWIVSLLLWILLMWKAFSGEQWAVPGVGEYAHRIAGR